MENEPVDARRFKGVDYLKITVLGFAMAALANAMHAIILPMRVEEVSGPAYKSTYLGILTFAGLLIAMLIQPVVGTISDHTACCIGRRKPFILVGITLALSFLFASGAADNYSGLLVTWCFLQASLNIAQGPFQAYIPDLTPQDKRGQASGLKALLEIAGGVALLSLIGRFMGRYSPGTEYEWLWISLGLLGFFLAAAMIATVVTVREPTGQAKPLPWGSIWYNIVNLRLKTNPAFLQFMLSRLLFVMGLTTLQTFALYYFKDVVGAANPSKTTADLITAVGLSMLIVVFPAGRYSDKIGRRLILMICGLLGAAGVALIFFKTDYSWIIFAGSLIGIAAGGFLSVNWALATDLIPPGQSARYLGLANLASAGGAALARLIGPAIDFFNRFSLNLGYTLMLAACLLYFLLASLFIWRIKIPYPAGIVLPK